MSSNVEMVAADYSLSAMGAKGCTLIKDTTSHTGKWRAVQVIGSATFTTLTSDCTLNASGTQATATDFGTLSEGYYTLPNITVIQLSSGVVIAYA